MRHKQTAKQRTQRDLNNRQKEEKKEKKINQVKAMIEIRETA